MVLYLHVIEFLSCAYEEIFPMLAAHSEVERVVKLVNQKDQRKSSIIIDELPTIY